jgi:Kef-type K+ transport system membrane component KefB
MTEWLRWDWTTPTGPMLLFALAAVLVLGALAGELVARTARLSRVVGYTAVGAGAAALGHGMPVPWPEAVALIVDIALGLLLFEIGSRVHLGWLARNPGLLATSVLESALAGVAVGGVLFALGIDVSVAAACAVIAMPGSAAVCGRVALEMGAAGQVTRRITLLTALNTLYAVLAATVLQLWWAAGHAPELLPALAALARSFFGSMLIAAVLAAAVAVAASRLDLRDESTVLLLLGLVVAGVAAARHFELSTLLVPLLAGLLLRQSTDRAWVWPRQFGTVGGALLLLLFVVVGASWSPQTLAAGGLAALAMVIVRGLAKGAAVMALAPWAQASARQGLALSIASTPMSATALVLLVGLLKAAPQHAQAALPIVVTAVAVLELLGPVAVHWALRHAGEIAPPASPKPSPGPTA